VVRRPPGRREPRRRPATAPERGATDHGGEYGFRPRRRPRTRHRPAVRPSKLSVRHAKVYIRPAHTLLHEGIRHIRSGQAQKWTACAGDAAAAESSVKDWSPGTAPCRPAAVRSHIHTPEEDL